MGSPLSAAMAARASGYAVVKLSGDSTAFSEYWWNSEKVWFMGHYYRKAGKTKIAVLKMGTSSVESFAMKLEEIENLFKQHGFKVEIDDITAFCSKHSIKKELVPHIISRYLSD